MWKLSKLEIDGFKSFAEHSELSFPEGITAVVGPNGCGKSNISDAIVWALGEQSTNALRAQRMADVIFQGSANRKPTTLAEVSLHLTRANGHNGHGPGSAPALGNGASGNGLATDGGGSGNGHGPLHGEIAIAGDDVEELVITRRLFRSGDSEYLIDGQRCRLKDIKERLLGTGLGIRACFTIEQGKIDEILSASPVERRGPLEEAAGITLYRKRRHATKLKLEAATQDLARVEDICSEVGRQMRSLKRQAGRARRYKEHREELRQLERRWFARAFATADHRLRIAQAAVAGAQAAEQAARETLDQSVAQWEEARQELRQRRAADEARRQALYRAQVENERLKAEASRLQDRAKFAEERLGELRHQIGELERRYRDAGELLERREEAASEAEAAAAAAAEALEGARRQLDAARPEPETRPDAATGPDAAAGDDDADSRTEDEAVELELRSLGERLSFQEGCGDAVRLALGGLLQAPVLDEETFPLWLSACREDRFLVTALRGLESDAAVAPDAESPDDERVQGRLCDRVEVEDAAAAVILRGLLGTTWVASNAEAVVELARLHPRLAFVDAEGTCWARGAEVRVRGARAGEEAWRGQRVPLQRRLRVRRPRPAEPGVDEPEGATAAEGSPFEARLGTEVDISEAEVAELERSVRQAETTHRAAQAQARALEQEVVSLRESRRRLDDELNRARSGATELERVVETSRRDAAKALEGADKAAAHCRKLQDEVEATSSDGVSAEAEVAGLEAVQAAARRALESAQRGSGQRDVEAAEARSDRNHLAEQIRERLGVDPEQLLDDEPDDDVPAEELRARITELRDKIDRLGPVNLVAYDDYLEQKERFEDLDGKRTDLNESVTNLEAAIERMDRECAQRFEEAFDAIDGYFNRIFRQLFGGGRAGMRLENPEDPLSSGIEIVAQPPGKSLQSIRLLSGGERTLVALSLMFAIFEYRPAPFCILDEADAALDETNVQRFAQALGTLQERAQFILITHNKRTMEVADLLYGVTMEESGVSKLVSVELN